MSTRRWIALVWVTGLLLPAQVAEHANERYQTEQQRRQMADAFLRAGRDQQQKPRELVQALGLKPGMTVADVGTGSGYMLPFLSRAVGPTGRVLAEDIFPDFLERARQHAEAEHLANVTMVLGTENGANLPDHGVDVALVLDAYHHFNYPKQMLASLRAALRPGGRLALVDYYRRPEAMGRGGYAMEHIRADQPEVIREVEAGGFRLVEKHDHVPGSQYVLTFEARGLERAGN